MYDTKRYPCTRLDKTINLIRWLTDGKDDSTITSTSDTQPN